VSYEGLFDHPDRKARWLRLDYVPDRDPAGDVHGFVGMITDITERKQAEEELRRSKERLEEAQRTAQIGDWEYDILAGKTTWSAEVYRIFGLDPDTYVPNSKSDEMLCHPDDTEALRRAFDEFFASGEPMDLDYRIATPKGTFKFIRRRGRLILDEQGSPSLAIGTTEDITERKEAEQRVLEYQHRLQALASQLTLAEERERRRIARELHDEVGQRLTFARMGLASASETASDAQQEAILEDVSQAVRQAIGDIRDLIFDLSSPLMDEVGLAAALEEWMEEQVGKKYGLQTEFVHDGQLPHLDDDVRAILFRSARELLTNVVKHAQATRVLVRLEGEGALVRIVVEDDGIGCDVDALPRAMEREDGFGLFSIQERMADLGGSLEIATEPGKGCKAVLTAPTAIQ
jgi:PAS domain S-box-containing protein